MELYGLVWGTIVDGRPVVARTYCKGDAWMFIDKLIEGIRKYGNRLWPVLIKA